MMSLAELQYIERALETLDSHQTTLETLAQQLKGEFEQIAKQNHVDYLNILTRVKGRTSLKEKILRNSYYKKYRQPETLIYELSDLIGLRIECRFEEDERRIYKLLKKYFNVEITGGFSHPSHPMIALKFDTPQPQKQKNGFKIYRIDGFILNNGEHIPFELQIKSLVNTFWGEVEHKIIYKNYNYLVGDTLLIEMLHAIKNNLGLLDKQLLSIYRSVDSRDDHDIFHKQRLEVMLGKMCSDVFSKQIKRSIGMNVNIKKDCQTIMNYTYSKEFTGGEEEHGKALVHAIARLNEINAREIEFNRPVTFEREPQFTTTFTKRLGHYFMIVMNEEFHWNLFFKILFEIEPLNNVADFEKFLIYLEECFMLSPKLSRYQKQIDQKYRGHTYEIFEDLQTPLVEALIEVDHVEMVYDYNIQRITYAVGEHYKKLIHDVGSYSDYLTQKEDLRQIFKQTLIKLLTQ